MNEIIGISVLCKNKEKDYDELIRISRSRVSYTRVFKDLSEKTILSTKTTNSKFEKEFYDLRWRVRKEFENEKECIMKEDFDFNIRLIFSDGTKLNKSYKKDFAENNLSDIARMIRQICRHIEYCPICINEFKIRDLNKAALEQIKVDYSCIIRIECGGTLDCGGRVDVVTKDTVYSDNLFYNEEADLTQEDVLNAFKVPDDLLNKAFENDIAVYKIGHEKYYCYHIGQFRFLIFNKYFAYEHNLNFMYPTMPMLELWNYWEYLMARVTNMNHKVTELLNYRI